MSATTTITAQDLHAFLRRAITQLRWAVLAGLLVLMVAQPTATRLGFPSWALLGCFAAYNLALGLWWRRRPGTALFARTAILDLLAATVLYVLGNEPGGPLFVLFLLAVDSAAASLTIRGVLVYTGVVALVVAGGDALLWAGMPGAADLRMLGVRLIMLAIVAVGMTILTRRLALEHMIARAANREAERLEELSRVRTDFVASISHELRTPLTAARAALGLLHTSAADRMAPGEQNMLRNAQRNAERLSMLIDDLLAFHQLEAGTLHLTHEPLDLAAVVRTAATAVQPLLVKQQQGLALSLGEPLPVAGDARRLEQVFVNLLANAHQHTPSGTSIAVAGERCGDEIRLRVADDGPGVPETELENMFGRFRRGSGPTGGAGLGLAIARAIVEHHGGRLWAEQSAPGTVFVVALPAHS